MLAALWPDVALAGIQKPVRKDQEEKGGGEGSGDGRERESRREERKEGRGERREQGRIGSSDVHSFNTHIQLQTTGCHSPVQPQ